MTVEATNLYALAGVVRDEAFLNSQLQLAGSNQSRMMETLQKNKRSAKNQALVVKIVYAIIIGLLPVIPLIMYFQVMGIPITRETLTFVSVTLLILYFGMNPLYVIILGIISTSGYMSGEVFEWVEILPIPRATLQKVEFIVMWRFFDIPLLTVVVVFPIVMAWAAGSVTVFFVCLGVSALYAMFLFCILVIITDKFSRIMKGGGANSRKASVLRVIAMLGYAIGAGSVGLFINLAIQSIGTIIQTLTVLENAELINMALSLVPFPFAPAYLVTFFLFPTDQLSLPLFASTLIGVVLLAILTWRLYRLVLVKMQNLTSHQRRVEPLVTQKLQVPIQTRRIQLEAPVNALLRKDLASLTRDFQGALFLFFPLVFPFVIFFQVRGPDASLSWLGGDVSIYNYVLIFLVVLTFMNATMLVSGLLGIEDSGASILASLPIIPRDQVKAKFKIMCPVQFVSSLLPMIVFAGEPVISTLIPLVLAYCPLGMAILVLTFALKIRLFGKMRHRYVLEEVNQTRNVGKWVTILGLDAAILLGIWLLFFFQGATLTLVGMQVILAGAGVVVLGVGFSILNRLCPTVTS